MLCALLKPTKCIQVIKVLLKDPHYAKLQKCFLSNDICLSLCSVNYVLFTLATLFRKCMLKPFLAQILEIRISL